MGAVLRFRVLSRNVEAKRILLTHKKMLVRDTHFMSLMLQTLELLCCHRKFSFPGSAMQACDLRHRCLALVEAAQLVVYFLHCCLNVNQWIAV